MAAKTPTIEIFESYARNAHYYRVRGRNGEIVVTSEGYTRRADAVRAAKRLKTVVAAAELVNA